jgi:hypothetical protein
LPGERILETDSNGRVRERSVKSGDYAWLPEPATRSLTNSGVTPLELVEVELK